ncbi:hypothetical protein ACOMHN_031916 [Nucella lapillus]
MSKTETSFTKSTFRKIPEVKSGRARQQKVREGPFCPVFPQGEPDSRRSEKDPSVQCFYRESQTAEGQRRTLLSSVSTGRARQQKVREGPFCPVFPQGEPDSRRSEKDPSVQCFHRESQTAEGQRRTLLSSVSTGRARQQKVREGPFCPVFPQGEQTAEGQRRTLLSSVSTPNF